MKKLIARLILLIVVAAVVAGAYYLVQQLPGDQAVDELALVEVKRGDLTVATHLRGELRAVRSLTLTAPNLGSQSQVIQLAPPGSLAQRGDLIVELDDSERVAALEDDLLSVDKIKEQLKQAETELEIRKTQDEVEIVKADFQVRRYELEVRRNELLSSIDARKNELSLEEAKARKTKLEEDIKNRLTQREAELAVLREQLKKAELDVDRERRRIEQARVLAPISGLVSILENRSGGRGGFGTTTPTIREGDQIPAGISVAQLLDLSEMELIAKVEEVERANLREGQEAVIRLDALPGREIKGTVKRLGTTASMNVFRGEATKKFDAILGIDMRQLLQNVGAKPDQIERILATARVNAAQGFGSRPRPAAAPGLPGAGGPGGGRPGGAGAAGRAGGGPGGAGARAGGGGQAGGAGGQGGGGQRRMSPEMQKRLQELSGGKDISELSQEERRNLFQQMRSQFGGQGGGQNGGGPGGAAGPGAGGPGGGSGSAAAGEFTAAQRKAATLPRPPEEGSDVEILLRPGLLADAEIIVDSMKDVLYVPYQSVFDTPQGHIVYLWNGKTLERRSVELGRRSESQVVIASGLEEGDMISLEPPASERREKKTPKKKSGGAPKTGVPGGGMPGGRGGMI
ncbi:MAG: HlyD family efflux transporter periplasmic adaptor subunit [Bryobacterales bacterium]